MEDPKMTVEVEVEVTRREKVLFTVDVSEGMSETNTTWEVGRFWRSVNYHVQSTRDLGKRESAHLVGLRFVPSPYRKGFEDAHLDNPPLLTPEEIERLIAEGDEYAVGYRDGLAANAPPERGL